MTPEPDRLVHAPAAEWGPELALLPIAATLAYYVLPASLQAQSAVQFVPQLLAYAALFLWASLNSAVRFRLGLDRANVRTGLRQGLITGLALGGLNTCVILAVFPFLGYDITFLRQTPHGLLPLFVMIPWMIGIIALFVELNFRGFILGRLATLESRLWRSGTGCRFTPLALLTTSLLFAFDPFMVNTFQHLHWIAVWDGLIWGAIRLRTGNLYTIIVAHAVEVLIMYSAVKWALA
ncbi:MAG: CPBP family intramembrane metalloprotease [Nitrospira sp.]|nr:CPBP family intramembrane metalloprotease [Nitrospira sp.]